MRARSAGPKKRAAGDNSGKPEGDLEQWEIRTDGAKRRSTAQDEAGTSQASRIDPFAAENVLA